MRSNESAADDCHAPVLDLRIDREWGDAREEQDIAFAAALNARLRSVVVDRIVPRLAMIHRDWAPRGAVARPSPSDIEAFGEAILAADASGADRLFQRLREKGLGVDELFETLLAPTARRLGELWVEDVCDFVDVTVGVNRLRMLLERYSNTPAQIGDSRRRALLIATREERHLFGLDIVASFLRASGWDVTLAAGVSADEAAGIAAESWFAIAAVTVSLETGLDAAARALEATRRASLNPSVGLMAGGAALIGRPELAARLGVDSVAENGPCAAMLAQKLYAGQVGGAPPGACDAPSQSRIQASKASN